MNTNKIYAEHIINEYSAKKESKVIALKKLDRKAKAQAEIFGYSFGVIMTLVLGFGMCLSMNIFGDKYFVLGIVIGIIGLIGVSINYIIYKRILENGKAKYAGSIMKLAQEIYEEE